MILLVYSLVDWVRLEESKERRSRLPMKMKGTLTLCFVNKEKMGF